MKELLDVANCCACIVAKSELELGEKCNSKIEVYQRTNGQRREPGMKSDCHGGLVERSKPGTQCQNTCFPRKASQ